MPGEPILPLGLASWERSMQAVEMVRARLLRTTAALDRAGIPYAVIGANAVAWWVARVDRGGVRNTPNVDLLLRRADLDRARGVLVGAGFEERETLDTPAFVDRPQARLREALRLYFAGEKLKTEYLLPAPDVSESQAGECFRVLDLEPLVRMKLTSFRTVDRVHLDDMADVGLIDPMWPARFPPELAVRLQHILDTPGG